MLIHVQFLWTHLDILFTSVILVIVVKTIVAATVTRVFGYNTRTAFIVGLLLAEIGEFAFVLLSRASNLDLTGVTTPVLFKLIPAAMHLGVLMHWFPAESSGPITPNEEKVSMIEANRIL